MEQLKLNMIPNGVNPVFHASQYDKGRQIRFVLDETLSSAEVTTSYRAKDGTEHGNVQTSVSGNTITDTIPEEVLTDYGIIEGEVNIDGIGSLNFFVEVEKDAYDGGVITTQTATGAIATFETNIETAFVSLKSDINPVQSGTGTPSPQNVRPISGFSALNVTRTGKNLFDKTTATTGAWVNAVGTTNPGSNRAYSDYIFIELNTPYYFSNVEGNSTFTTVIVYDRDKNIIGTKTLSGSGIVSGTLTFTEGYYIRVNTNEDMLDTVQIELGNQASTYEPYNGQTATVNFGQTVYGGVADVTNGKVTLTHGYHQLTGTEDWAWAKSSSYSGGFYTPVASVGAKVATPFICTHAKTALSVSEYEWGTCYCDGSLNIRIMQASDTVQDWKTYLANQYANGTPVSICFELATPIEITTTPENLTAISGENNVYGDTNGDTTVEYYIEV